MALNLTQFYHFRARIKLDKIRKDEYYERKCFL